MDAQQNTSQTPSLESLPVNDYSLTGYCNKLKGRLYGLLCEREKNGSWIKFLDTIFLELYGFVQFDKTINYWPLLAKIASLKYLDYEYFRKTIFECINLVGGMTDDRQ